MRTVLYEANRSGEEFRAVNQFLQRSARMLLNATFKHNQLLSEKMHIPLCHMVNLTWFPQRYNFCGRLDWISFALLRSVKEDSSFFTRCLQLYANVLVLITAVGSNKTVEKCSLTITIRLINDEHRCNTSLQRWSGETFVFSFSSNNKYFSMIKLNELNY